MSKAAQQAAQTVRLIVGAGKASPTPPVGPALGARGVKAMDFCKEYNSRTASLVPGTPIPVLITIQPDRTFTFTTKPPPTMHLLKLCAGLETASGTPGTPTGSAVGTISVKHVYEVAKIKMLGEGGSTEGGLEGVARKVVGQCRSAGIKVVL
ncbi:hypothetical protein JCM11641_006215 [Rhodosporidiobolus odoratus]